MRIVANVLVASVALAMAALVWSVSPAAAQTPGRVPPSVSAADRDPRLTALARSALPILAAIERYLAEHGRFPDRAAAASLMIDRMQTRDLGNFVAFGDWLYYAMPNGGGFTLSRSLGRDPRLVYERKSDAKRWIYDPGDGSEEKEIVLEP